MLHPRHKLAYFKSARWEENWIETAASLVREEFKCSYLEVDIQENHDGDVEMVGPGVPAVTMVDDPPVVHTTFFFLFVPLLNTIDWLYFRISLTTCQRLPLQNHLNWGMNWSVT